MVILLISIHGLLHAEGTMRCKIVYFTRKRFASAIIYAETLRCLFASISRIFGISRRTSCILFSLIRHFHIVHNALCLPQKLLRKYCFIVPREIENNACARCLGVNTQMMWKWRIDTNERNLSPATLNN